MHFCRTLVLCAPDLKDFYSRNRHRELYRFARCSSWRFTPGEPVRYIKATRSLKHQLFTQSGKADKGDQLQGTYLSRRQHCCTGLNYHASSCLPLSYHHTLPFSTSTFDPPGRKAACTHAGRRQEHAHLHTRTDRVSRAMPGPPCPCAFPCRIAHALDALFVSPL